jgi:hypothetical protein
MNKPIKQTEWYYDWDSSWKYLKEKYNFKDCIIIDEGEEIDIWNYIAEAKGIVNNKIFSFSNWEIVYNNGQYRYMIPEDFIPILIAILDEFGEIDSTCLTPNVKIAQFLESW